MLRFTRARVIQRKGEPLDLDYIQNVASISQEEREYWQEYARKNNVIVTIKTRKRVIRRRKRND